VVLLRLPPLREHREDIPLLVEEFCRMLGEKHRRPAPAVSREAMERLMAAEWRGNVRELKNALESAMVMSSRSVLSPEDFPSDSLRTVAGPFPAHGEAASAPLLAISDYREAKRRFEIAYIKAKLHEHGGNITRTATAIRIHRQSLQEKLRELGIQAEKE